MDSGSGTAEERLKAIEYLEKRLGVASGGSWNDALALQEGAKRPADDPPAGRPGCFSRYCPSCFWQAASGQAASGQAASGKAPCRGEAQGSGQGKAPAASSRVSCTCRRTRPQSLPLALLRLLSSACSPPPALLRLLSSPPALLRLLSSACSLRLLSSACSPPPALLRLLSPACSPPPALPRLLSSACSPPPALLRLLSSQAQGSGKDKARAASSQVSSTCSRTVSSACSPSPALLHLLSSACSPPPALLRLLSSACSHPPALLRLLSSACSPPPALLLSSACSPPPALLNLLSSQAQGSGKDKARAAMANLGELSSACSPPSAFVRLAHSDTALAQRMHLDLLDLPLDILGQVADMLDVSCLQRLSRTCAYSFGVFLERCKARTQWRNSIRSVRQKAEDKLTRKRERTGCRVSMEANEELLREEMCAAKASLACALKECWDFLRGQKYPGEVAAGRGQPQQDPNKSLTLEDESWLHEQYVIHVNSMTNATGRMEPRAPVDGRALRGQICALGCSMAGSRSTRGQARAPDRSGWAPLMETFKKWKSAAEIAFRSRRQELLKAQTGTA